MKKIVVLISLIIISINTVNACEICGCGLGNYYIGLMPKFKHKFVGLRYQYKHFNTVMADDPTQFSKDYFRSVELWGGWNIGKRWQVLAVIPYNYIHQVSDDGAVNNNGLGDITALVNYKLFDRTSAFSKTKLFTQQLWIGAGVKAPTGKFNADAADPAIVAMANTQSGSASTDFILNGIYNAGIGKLGVNSSVSYKINTANKDKYYFGNRFSANSFVSYTLGSKVQVTPNIGLLYENMAASKLDKTSIAQTGGNAFNAAGGLEITYKAVSVGANVQLPISQRYASGQTEMKVRGMVHFTVGF